VALRLGVRRAERPSQVPDVTRRDGSASDLPGVASARASRDHRAAMHANETLITRFYEAFTKRDAEGMAACYADDVRFSDPVFQNLEGERAKNMWRMLCERGKDLRIEFRDVQADDTKGSAHWEARYTFSMTGRLVHNVIDASFVFRDGKIVEHVDRFDLWRWAGSALGAKGKLLGWTPFVHKAVRKNALKGLDAWSAKAR
jgi:ketosteroid isomerase-like protein